MKVQHVQQTPSEPVNMQGARGCAVRWLLSESDGAPNFSMRHFELAPGGHTPKHSHPFEHEVFVLEGQGVVLDGDVERPLRPGAVVLVQPDEVHQFRNSGAQPFRLLCLIPNSGDCRPDNTSPECGGP